LSISAIDKVDFVTRNPAGKYVLVILADEPWEDTDDFRGRLEEKANNYTSYFLDGQMRKQYPDCKQDRITIRISSSTQIPQHAAGFIRQLGDALAEHGIDFETEVI
jgi:hypothetical protein